MRHAQGTSIPAARARERNIVTSAERSVRPLLIMQFGACPVEAGRAVW